MFIEQRTLKINRKQNKTYLNTPKNGENIKEIQKNVIQQTSIHGAGVTVVYSSAVGQFAIGRWSLPSILKQEHTIQWWQWREFVLQKSHLRQKLCLYIQAYKDKNGKHSTENSHIGYDFLYFCRLLFVHNVIQMVLILIGFQCWLYFFLMPLRLQFCLRQFSKCNCNTAPSSNKLNLLFHSNAESRCFRLSFSSLRFVYVCTLDYHFNFTSSLFSKR